MARRLEDIAENRETAVPGRNKLGCVAVNIPSFLASRGSTPRRRKYVVRRRTLIVAMLNSGQVERI